MTQVTDEHVCCEHAYEAWEIIRELERRFNIISNAVRGTDRFLNRRPRLGGVQKGRIDDHV